MRETTHRFGPTARRPSASTRCSARRTTRSRRSPPGARGSRAGAHAPGLLRVGNEVQAGAFADSA